MKKFVIKLSVLVMLIGSSILIWCGWQKNDILTITNSISLDTRLYEMRNMNRRQYDIIALGSSMTLYHLDGDTFMDERKENSSFYNFSAWGLTLDDDRVLMEYLVDEYKPKEVIMFGNILDFSEGQKSRINRNHIEKYLDKYFLNDFENILNFGFPNNLETKKEYMDRRFNPSELNEDLRYDRWGGVLLNVYGDDILPVRYNAYYEDTPSEIQYEALAYIADYLQKKNIVFYYVQTPFREHYLNGDLDLYELMNSHCEKCKDIVEKSGGYYKNFIDFTKYDDSYFADCVHLNRDGALLLTQEFTAWYESIK